MNSKNSFWRIGSERLYVRAMSDVLVRIVWVRRSFARISLFALVSVSRAIFPLCQNEQQADNEGLGILRVSEQSSTDLERMCQKDRNGGESIGSKE